MSNDVSPIPKPDVEGWETDSLSAQEQKNWRRYDEISSVKKKNTVLIHRTIGYMIPIGLAASFLGFLALAGVYVWHLIARHDYRWLKPDELQNIHSIVFSSVVGGAIAILARTYFKEGMDEKK